MPQCIAAVFKAALKLLQALLCPPKGRHSRRSRPHRRRRRSSRVRRYAPLIPAAPTPLPSHPAARKRQVKTRPRPPAKTHPEPPDEPRPEPRRKLRSPTVELDADDITLVRPYYTAHEAEADRAQDRAALRLRAWGADLDLEFGPKRGGAPVHTLDGYCGTRPDGRTERTEPSERTGPASETEQAPDPRSPTDTFHVPAPRTPAPRLPSRMDRLPHLSRIRDRQQQRRATHLTGAGA